MLRVAVPFSISGTGCSISLAVVPVVGGVVVVLVYSCWFVWYGSATWLHMFRGASRGVGARIALCDADVRATTGRSHTFVVSCPGQQKCVVPLRGKQTRGCFVQPVSPTGEGRFFPQSDCQSQVVLAPWSSGFAGKAETSQTTFANFPDCWTNWT